MTIHIGIRYLMFLWTNVNTTNVMTVSIGSMTAFDIILPGRIAASPYP